jgi:hypothetical protein
MMATTVVLSNVIKEPAPSTRCRVQFTDGTELEFGTLAELREWALGIDSGPMGAELTRRMCLARLLALSPELTNINQIQGKNFTFDLTNAQPVRVQ